jgi:spore coat-associated protein N
VTRRRPETRSSWLLLVLAAGLVVATLAITAGTPTPARAVPATRLVSGTLSMSNSRQGSAILTATGMAPGGKANGTVQIGNSGDLPGDFTLASSNLSDAPGPLGGQLSSKLLLSVRDVTGPGPGTSVYSGPLAAMGSVAVGTIVPGATRTYRFTVDFPDGGAADNDYRDSSTSIEFDWSATDSPAGQGGAATPSGSGGAQPDVGGSDTGSAPAAGDDSQPGAAGSSPAKSKPLLTVTAARVQRPMRQKGIVVKVTCRSACTITAAGQIAPARRARGVHAIKLRRITKKLRAGKATKLTLKLSRKQLGAARKALAARRRMVAKLKITGKAAGTKGTAARTIKLRR